METLLFIAAEGREFAGLRRHCHGEKRLAWPLRFARTANLRGLRIVLAAHGAGPALAGQACEVAWAKHRAQAIVSAGFCGALDPGLSPGEVFVAASVNAPERNLRFPAMLPRCRTSPRQGELVSVDRVVQTREEKIRLRNRGADVVEMEAVAVAERARAWGVPFFCVRSVTDLADESFEIDLNAARDRDGRLSDSRVILAALRRPGRLLPEVYKLYCRSRLAARNLGDFIAACEF